MYRPLFFSFGKTTWDSNDRRLPAWNAELGSTPTTKQTSTSLHLWMCIRLVSRRIVLPAKHCRAFYDIGDPTDERLQHHAQLHHCTPVTDITLFSWCNARNSFHDKFVYCSTVHAPSHQNHTLPHPALLSQPTTTHCVRDPTDCAPWR